MHTKKIMNTVVVAASISTLMAGCAIHPPPKKIVNVDVSDKVVISKVHTKIQPEPNLSSNIHKASKKEKLHKSSHKLVVALSKRFHKPESYIEIVVSAATKYSSNIYPLRNEILAIIAVESKFDSRASFEGSKGLMQIQVSSHAKNLKGKHLFNIDDNISVGVSILKNYYTLLQRNKRSTILAYNSGIGNFLNHKYHRQYYSKYLKELAFIQSIG